MKKTFLILALLSIQTLLWAQIAVDGDYTLAYKKGNDTYFLCLFNNSTEVGTNLSVCSEYNRINDWKITKTKDGYYYILNTATSLFLESQIIPPTENSKIILGPPKGTDKQKWTILPAGDNRYYFMPKLNDELYITEFGGKIVFKKYSSSQDVAQKFYQPMACPYVNILKDDKFVEISEILRNLRHKTLETSDSIDVPLSLVQSNKLLFRIEERKSEITYMDNIFLIVNDNIVKPDIEESHPLHTIDNSYFIFTQGDAIEISFQIPQDIKIKNIRIVATGYYEIIGSANKD